MQYVDVVVGGQYGSEAKGHVTAQLVKQSLRSMREAGVEGTTINVRVAGPNAGHTVYDEKGQKFAFRTLPVGAVIDDSVVLYIAPGSEIDPEVLFHEIGVAERAGHRVTKRLFVSKQATVISPEHKEQEAALVGQIGSTGKGIGAARAARLLRSAQTIGDWIGEGSVPVWGWAEPEDLYANDEVVHNSATHVIIEGTQGFGLSLRASGHYPQVTSSDARAVDFLAMAGIDPTRCGIKIQNWIVARVFPIRVAGNSGPMEGETSWEALGLDEERTTVTQKVRRVGTWDLDLLRRAVQANGGHEANVVVTMLDQVIPGLRELEGVTANPEAEIQSHPALDEAIEWLNANASREQVGAYVAAFTFSPTDILWTPAAQPKQEQDAEALAQQVLASLFGDDEVQAAFDEDQN